MNEQGPAKGELNAGNTPPNTADSTFDRTRPRTAGGAAPTTGSVFFIGNATVLIRFGGFTILTDPTFIHMHEEVSIGYGMHSKRLTDPALEIADLPPLDFVLLSHFHGDHFDQVAEAELDKDASDRHHGRSSQRVGKARV